MRRYLIALLVSAILPAAAVTGINWLIDPYRIFHKPWVRDNYYLNTSKMRIEASGIINTEDFDSIILGTSMAANFSPNEASQVFRSHFVNISLDGSSIAERSIVLAYALKNRNLSRVIFSLDGTSSGNSAINGTPITPYIRLYDDNPLNDIFLYASNIKIMQYALCRNRVFSSNRLCPNTRDLETLVEWHSDWDHRRRFGGLSKWLAATNSGQVLNALHTIADSINAINSGKIKEIDWTEVAAAQTNGQREFKETLLSFAAKYPATNFYLFFPPCSRLQYAIMKQSTPQAFENYLETVRFMVQESARYSNIKVFGFETESFLDDIANYKDTSHYHQRYNSKMLRWMKSGEHQLTPSNLDAYIAVITERAANYPLKNIGAQIDAYLARKP
ncbi:hypothetical protein [uncultured Thiodictyon sp.]|uniref:hypothetical protein n=1 Tax=uncultured Thiodictyon sp. TaxID=1846217 RepID=UPI0025EA49AF|nr:hypothetical protein [uncultured Thiodictyon sp.]